MYTLVRTLLQLSYIRSLVAEEYKVSLFDGSLHSHVAIDLLVAQQEVINTHSWIN